MNCEIPHSKPKNHFSNSFIIPIRIINRDIENVYLPKSFYEGLLKDTNEREKQNVTHDWHKHKENRYV